MTIQWSPAVRNARLDIIETTIGPSAKIQGFTGAQPANTAAAATGTKLIEITMASDWSTPASGGVKALANLPLVTNALAVGIIGYYRYVDSAGTVCHEQGSVTATGGGGDMTVDNPSVTLNQEVRITAFAKTEAGA